MLDLETSYKKFNLSSDKIPNHVAMIMDGNGRWAQAKLLPRVAGHKKGADTVRLMVKLCMEFGVKYLSIFAFSTENWTRPKKEVNFLFGLFNQLIHSEIDALFKQGVSVKVIGEREGLPDDLIKNITLIEEKTSNNDKLCFQIMLNYGARQEILSAIKQCLTDVENKKIERDDIDEKFFSSYLQTHSLPDPDIILRTSGELRLSNFLLWQGAYSELIFIKTLWPDFGKTEFVEMLREYQNRKRRFGGVYD